MAQLKETVIHGNLTIDENIIWRGGRIDSQLLYT